MNVSEIDSEIASSSSTMVVLQPPGGPIYCGMGECFARGQEKKIVFTPHFFYQKPKDGLDIWKDFFLASALFPEKVEKIPIDNVAHKPRLLTYRCGLSDQKSWMATSKLALEKLRSRELKKIVLARTKSWQFTADEQEMLGKDLWTRLMLFPGKEVYRFFWKRGGSSFFGATPELLFHRKDGKIFVPAIAGTVKNSHSKASEDLLKSHKDREEHDFVVQGIYRCMMELHLNPDPIPQPTLKPFGPLLHLFTPLSCIDPGKEILSNELLIQTLHPTPAIGGDPKESAMAFIFQEEEWNRGLYASPLLFSLPGEDICLVAIRSALWREKSLTLFAGAGFVRDSDPLLEWQETENKMEAMEHLFFMRDRNQKDFL